MKKGVDRPCYWEAVEWVGMFDDDNLARQCRAFTTASEQERAAMLLELQGGLHLDGAANVELLKRLRPSVERDDAVRHLLGVHALVATLGAWGGAPAQVIEAEVIEEWRRILTEPDEDSREVMATK